MRARDVTEQRQGEEYARVQALHALGVVRADLQPAFQRLVASAAASFRAPIAVLCLIDGERTHVKSAVGVPLGDMPREDTFCSLTVHLGRLLVVPDATAHPLFARSALVTGPPHVRFYAGAPLVTASGHAIGALAVMDVVVRDLADADRAHLQNMARFAADELLVRQYVRLHR